MGIVISGSSELVKLFDGEYGPPHELGNNEVLYCRTMTTTLPGCVPVTRIAVRIENKVPQARCPPRVAFAILVKASRGLAHRASPQTRTNKSVGVRGLHLLPLSFFSRRVDPDERRETECYDNFGYQTVYPSTITVEGTHNLHMGVSAGHQRHVLTSRLLGSDLVGDETYRPAQTATQQSWIAESNKRADVLKAEFGPDAVFAADEDASRVLDMLSGSFLLQCLGSQMLSPVVPDLFHSPLGIPLFLTMAANVALSPKRYGLHPPSRTDQYACEEIREQLSSQWSSVNGGSNSTLLAVDIALHNGYQQLFPPGAKLAEEIRERVTGNLTLLQRIGHQTITGIVTHRPRAHKQEEVTPTMCRSAFARVEAIQQQAWGAEMADDDCAIATTDKGNVHEDFIKAVSSTEHWLRTGMYNEHRMNAPNARSVHNASLAGSMTAEEKACSLKECEHLCIDAVDKASDVFVKWCTHGPMAATDTFGFTTFLVSQHEHTPCCSCGEPIHVLSSFLMNIGGSACKTCHRRRCFICSALVVKAQNEHWNPCLKCRPEQFITGPNDAIVSSDSDDDDTLDKRKARLAKRVADRHLEEAVDSFLVDFERSVKLSSGIK